jgi:hypothetical protein
MSRETSVNDDLDGAVIMSPAKPVGQHLLGTRSLQLLPFATGCTHPYWKSVPVLRSIGGEMSAQRVFR